MRIDLKFYRVRRGLSPAELARRSGVDLAVISRLENQRRIGKRKSSRGASYETIVRLAAALEMDPLELAPVLINARRTPPIDIESDEP